LGLVGGALAGGGAGAGVSAAGFSVMTKSPSVFKLVVRRKRKGASWPVIPALSSCLPR
jgi:hypothetical protein